MTLLLMRYWFYIAAWAFVALVILLAPWWVTLTLLLTITISVLVSLRYLGRWAP